MRPITSATHALAALLCALTTGDLRGQAPSATTVVQPAVEGGVGHEGLCLRR